MARWFSLSISLIIIFFFFACRNYVKKKNYNKRLWLQRRIISLWYFRHFFHKADVKNLVRSPLTFSVLSFFFFSLFLYILVHTMSSMYLYFIYTCYVRHSFTRLVAVYKDALIERARTLNRRLGEVKAPFIFKRAASLLRARGANSRGL